MTKDDDDDDDNDYIAAKNWLGINSRNIFTKINIRSKHTTINILF